MLINTTFAYFFIRYILACVAMELFVYIAYCLKVVLTIVRFARNQKIRAREAYIHVCQANLTELAESASTQRSNISPISGYLICAFVPPFNLVSWWYSLTKEIKY